MTTVQEGGSLRALLNKTWVGATLGIIALLLIWTAASTVFPSKSIIPTPWGTVAEMADGIGSYFIPNLSATLERAGWGYLWGNAIGLLIAGIVLLLPKLEEVITQLGVISQCLPITAVGPIIIVIFGGRTASVFLAALLVFFTTMVGAILGMRYATATQLDVVTAAGGGNFAKIRKVRLLASLPSVFTALKIAVPGAILGAVVGEYLGGIDRGVGVALIAAQREQNPERVWAMCLFIGLVSLAGYGLVGLIGRWVTPWAQKAGGR